jgi:hypothetical protein
VQSGSKTVLTLTGLASEVVTINLNGVVEGHLLSTGDMVNGSASLIAPAPTYPTNGGNGLANVFVLDPFLGSYTIYGFENGLDQMDLRPVLQSGYWDAALHVAPNSNDAVLHFTGNSGEQVDIQLAGMPYYLIDQSDYIVQ